MKQVLIKLAGGSALALAGMLVSAGGASASSDCDHQYNQGSNYQAGYSSHYSQSYEQNRYASYNGGSRNVYYGDTNASGGSGNVYYGNSGGGYSNSSSYGMMYGGKWYSYSQMGYYDNCGRWVSYRSDWSQNDWQQWAMQGCL